MLEHRRCHCVRGLSVDEALEWQTFFCLCVLVSGLPLYYHQDKRYIVCLLVLISGLLYYITIKLERSILSFPRVAEQPRSKTREAGTLGKQQRCFVLFALGVEDCGNLLSALMNGLRRNRERLLQQSFACRQDAGPDVSVNN